MLVIALVAFAVSGQNVEQLVEQPADFEVEDIPEQMKEPVAQPESEMEIIPTEEVD